MTTAKDAVQAVGRQVEVYDKTSVRAFEEGILRKGCPVLLKGLVASWPAVQAHLQSDEAIAGYIQAMLGVSFGACLSQAMVLHSDVIYTIVLIVLTGAMSWMAWKPVLRPTAND